MGAWLRLLERHGALLDDSWFGTNEHDHAEMREFRHQLPVMVNEWLARHGQRKVSTDMAVPDESFPEMLRFYKRRLAAARLQYVIFGHVGDGHVHVNLMPRDHVEAGGAPPAEDDDLPAPRLAARAPEYFHAESLHFLREHYPLVPLRPAGAGFF